MNSVQENWERELDTKIYRLRVYYQRSKPVENVQILSIDHILSFMKRIKRCVLHFVLVKDTRADSSLPVLLLIFFDLRPQPWFSRTTSLALLLNWGVVVAELNKSLTYKASKGISACRTFVVSHRFYASDKQCVLPNLNAQQLNLGISLVIFSILFFQILICIADTWVYIRSTPASAYISSGRENFALW